MWFSILWVVIPKIKVQSFVTCYFEQFDLVSWKKKKLFFAGCRILFQLHWYRPFWHFVKQKSPTPPFFFHFCFLSLFFWKYKFQVHISLLGTQYFGQAFGFLKLVSAIFIKFLFFHQMITIQKLWKMLFISSKKLFSFSRYSNFCISVLPSFSTCRPLL